MSECCCNPLGSAATPAGPVQPFIGRFFVSPSFAGTSTGSSANPFKTIAAAFAAGAAQGLVAGIIYLSAETFTENVVFPPGGGSWSLQAIEEFGTFSTTLTGTVTLDNNASTTFTEFSLNDLDIESPVTGVYSGGAGTDCVFRINNTFVDAAVTFTSTGGGRLVCEVLGQGLLGFEDGIVGALSVQGQLWATGATVFGLVSFQSVSFASGSRFQGGFASLTGISSLTLSDCLFIGAQNFTAGGGGSLVVALDGVSASGLMFNGCTKTGNVIVKTNNANTSAQLTLGNNQAPIAVAQVFPSSEFVAEAVITLLATGGGAAGNAVVSIVYTDMTGALVTEAVTPPLNVAGAVGTKVRGQLVCQQNGATPIQFSVTGVTVPGALSMAVAIAARQAS